MLQWLVQLSISLCVFTRHRFCIHIEPGPASWRLSAKQRRSERERSSDLSVLTRPSLHCSCCTFVERSAEFYIRFYWEICLTVLQNVLQIITFTREILTREDNDNNLCFYLDSRENLFSINFIQSPSSSSAYLNGRKIG